MFVMKVRAFLSFSYQVNLKLIPVFILGTIVLWFRDMHYSRTPLEHLIKLVGIGLILFMVSVLLLSVVLYSIGLSIKEIRNKYNFATNYNDLESINREIFIALRLRR